MIFNYMRTIKIKSALRLTSIGVSLIMVIQIRKGLLFHTKSFFEDTRFVVAEKTTILAHSQQLPAAISEHVGISANKTTSSTSSISEVRGNKKCKCVKCHEDQICGGLWHAKGFPPVGSEDPHDKKIHIVVSYCKSNLDWMSNFTLGFDIDSIDVISKCGQEAAGTTKAGSPLQENATILELPNVGRCDHSYAYYITNLLDKRIVKGEEKDSVVIFLKDDMSTENLHQPGHWSNLERMVREASSTNGFSCGVVPIKRFSVYHKVSAWFNFVMKSYDHKKELYKHDGVSFKSIYQNLGDFYKSVISSAGGGDPDTSISFPELVQVCYGGVFAASYSNIKKVDHSTWERIELALSRGNNIEEGHFMERSWGSLLATPLQPFQIEAMKNYTQRYAKFSRKPGREVSEFQPGLLLSPRQSAKGSKRGKRGKKGFGKDESR